eukprot:CAMPEP_0194221144 /NCGR_PEP_ID=MMETSP0156-20130528/29983_1 /TAXON_ID=33649 /ORGANISM="Thalassionema nitzschioides, Strain L26-B" /LENGTH=99 /DNA_ID=CAMNT_0038951451 /DNA_START=33 /DNA_END=329 /DNA_ORIENTATION=+
MCPSDDKTSAVLQRCRARARTRRIQNLRKRIEEADEVDSSTDDSCCSVDDAVPSTEAETNRKKIMAGKKSVTFSDKAEIREYCGSKLNTNFYSYDLDII